MSEPAFTVPSHRAAEVLEHLREEIEYRRLQQEGPPALPFLVRARLLAWSMTGLLRRVLRFARRLVFRRYW